MMKVFLTFMFFCLVGMANAQQDTSSSSQKEVPAQRLSDSLIQVFDTADIMPQFPGGQDSMFKFIFSRVEYPMKAKEDGISGRVLAEFVVSETGQLENIRIVKSVSPECDAEVIRIIKLMPNWIPGKIEDKPVSVKVSFPFRFSLD
ncbi:MAG: energy transducer TonB [Bacteroidetes bacterium]|nr:MAG: energy transducer TonB [Bacteroidota bacterium]